MGFGSGGCSTGGCGNDNGSGSCNKLNTFNWLSDMELPPYMRPFDIVEVRFKGTRKEFYKNPYNIDFYINEYVVVETENGYDIGQVALKGELVKLQLKKYSRSENEPDFKRIVRRAAEADIAKLKENQELEVPTMYKARSFAMELGLSMKLSDVEYQGDRRKATFFYTAEDRVDFRELIKKLADSFKVRIEMRQVGYRQEAARLGGIGSCGRELCCSTWLTDFKMVHTNSARYQNLSLNPLKLSGQCAKLKCCLNFELDSYMEALRDFPNENTVTLQFAEDKVYRSVKTDILKRLMWFAPQSEMGGEWLSFPVKQVMEFLELNKKGEKPALVIAEKSQLKTDKVELDFKNEMGVGSLTRLDEKQKRGNERKNKNRNQNRGNPTPRYEEKNERKNTQQDLNIKQNPNQGAHPNTNQNPNQQNSNQQNPNQQNPNQQNPNQQNPNQQNPNRRPNNNNRNRNNQNRNPKP